MIITINTNKIFINGTLNSYVNKLSNGSIAIFLKTHIRIEDVKVLFAAELEKWFRFILLHMVTVYSLLQGNAEYDENRAIGNNFLKETIVITSDVYINHSSLSHMRVSNSILSGLNEAPTKESFRLKI